MSCPRLGEVCHEYTCGAYVNETCFSEENLLNSTETSLPETSCNIPMPNVKSPKLELIPAAEAYKKTQEVLKETDLRLLEEINNKILKATEKGKFSITGLGTISFDVREKLESLGYEIRTGFSLNESYYLIHWEQEGD